MRRGGLLAAVAALALAGCSTAVEGTGTPPPDAAALIGDAVDAVRTVETGFALSLSVTGSARSVEITARTQGESGSATVTVDGDEAEVRNVDGAGFVKASAGFWTAYGGLEPGVAASVADQWVESGARTAPLLVYVSQASLAASLQTLGASPYRLDGRSEVDGVPAYRFVSGTSGSGTVEVTVEDPTRLLRVAAGDLGKSTFTYPTDEVSVTAPADPLPYPG